jgi:hypothetical protein
MLNRQYSNSANSCSPQKRIIAALVLGALSVGGGTLWLSARGVIDLGFWLGVCGFKQRFGLPCPGCGWTHAAQMFVTGHPIEAFIHQPAATFFCVVGVLTGFYALLIAVIGIDFGFPRRLTAAVGAKTLVLTAVIVLLAGWAVTLLRVILLGDGS